MSEFGETGTWGRGSAWRTAGWRFRSGLTPGGRRPQVNVGVEGACRLRFRRRGARGRARAGAGTVPGRSRASWTAMTHAWAGAQGRQLGAESVLPVSLGPVNGERGVRAGREQRAATGERRGSGWPPSRASVSAGVDVEGWILAACGVRVSLVMRRAGADAREGR